MSNNTGKKKQEKQNKNENAENTENVELLEEVETVEAAFTGQEQATVPPTTEGSTEGSNVPARRVPSALGTVGGDAENLLLMGFPRLQIAYGVGGLAETFQPGDLVLDQSILVAKKNERVKVIPLVAYVYWKEYLTNEMREAGVTPRVFATSREVLEAGGTIDWSPDNVPPTFSQAMDLWLLIKKPEHLEEGTFGLILSDEEYAPALWTIDKTAFRREGVKFLRSVKFIQSAGRPMYSAQFDTWTQIEKTRRGNTIILPKFKLAGYLDEDLIKNIEAFFKAKTAAEKARQAEEQADQTGEEPDSTGETQEQTEG